jgi:prepilin-type N-terminal cleavage/methylation domain-containing protein
MKKKLMKRCGYSLLEMVIVILIIGILAMIGVGFGSKQVSKARVSTTGNNLKLLASDVESAVYDLGFLTYDEILDESTREEYFNSWDATYMSAPLAVYPTSSYDGMVFVAAGETGGDYSFGDDFAGVVITTHDYTDAWDNPLRFYYLAPVTGEKYRIIIASAGPNGKFYDDDTSGYDDASGAYIAGEFDDDIVMVMEPRG